MTLSSDPNKAGAFPVVKRNLPNDTKLTLWKANAKVLGVAPLTQRVTSPVMADYLQLPWPLPYGGIVKDGIQFV